VIESYLAHCKAEGQQALTVKFKRSHLRHFEEVGGTLMEYILYLKMKGYNTETINVKHRVVKSYLEFIDAASYSKVD